MLATLASVNSANRLKQVLSSKSIPSRVIQTPSALTKEGCGYSLRFDDKYKPYVSSFAKSLKINIRAFFKEVNDNDLVQYIKE